MLHIFNAILSFNKETSQFVCCFKFDRELDEAQLVSPEFDVRITQRCVEFELYGFDCR